MENNYIECLNKNGDINIIYANNEMVGYIYNHKEIYRGNKYESYKYGEVDINGNVMDSPDHIICTLKLEVDDTCNVYVNGTNFFAKAVCRKLIAKNGDILLSSDNTDVLALAASAYLLLDIFKRVEGKDSYRRITEQTTSTKYSRVETPNYKEYKLKYFAQKYMIPLIIIFFVLIPVIFFSLFVYGMMSFLTADAKKNKKNK